MGGWFSRSAATRDSHRRGWNVGRVCQQPRGNHLPERGQAGEISRGFGESSGSIFCVGGSDHQRERSKPGNHQGYGESMKLLRTMAIGGLLLLSALSSRAATYSLQISDVTWMGSPGGYDCFTSAAYPNTVNFTITKTANGRKSYAVTAGTSANTGSYTRQLRAGGSRLNYQLYTTSAMNYALKAPPTALANEVLSGSLPGPAGQVIPLSFVFFIPPGQVVPPGTYTDQVTISIYN